MRRWWALLLSEGQVFFFRHEVAAYTSLRQRLRKMFRHFCATKWQHNNITTARKGVLYIALTGRRSFVRLLPKALPWARIFQAFSLPRLVEV